MQYSVYFHPGNELRRPLVYLEHEIVLETPRLVIGHHHVVEIAEIGQANAGRCHRRLDPVGALLVEGRPQIQRIGHRVEHRLRWYVGQCRMQCR